MSDTYAAWIATDQRKLGESAVGHLVRGILATVALGLDEAGMPLTAEQQAFLNDAAESLGGAS